MKVPVVVAVVVVVGFRKHSAEERRSQTRSFAAHLTSAPNSQSRRYFDWLVTRNLELPELDRTGQLGKECDVRDQC